MKRASLLIAAAAMALTASVAYGQSYDGRYDPGASYRDSYLSRPGGGWYPDWGADPNFTYYGGLGRDAAQGRGAWRPDWQGRQAYAPSGAWHPDWGADDVDGQYDGQYIDSNAGRIFYDRYGRAYTVDQYGVSRWIQ